MPDPRYNDIARKFRHLATDLDKTAATHRRLADQLDHIATSPPPAIDHTKAHIRALDAAALRLVDLPAADIRAAAPAVARALGQDVFAVAMRAQQMRRYRKAQARRKLTAALLTALARGNTLKSAAAKLSISEATARRVRDEWRDA